VDCEADEDWGKEQQNPPHTINSQSTIHTALPHGGVQVSTARQFKEGVCGSACYLKKATKTNDSNVKTVSAPALAFAA